MMGDLGAEARVADYRAWLVSERGLSRETARCYGNWAVKFAVFVAGPDGLGWEALDAAGVQRYVADQVRAAGSVETAKAMAGATRSFLRFALVRGWVTADLSAAVLSVASWRLSSTPSPLPAGAVGRLLDSCDLGTVTGLRDRAVLELLAGLGLRRAEVAGLDLGDVDWVGGLVTVTGKGAQTEAVPLPARAGEAIAAYVMGGRPMQAGALFLTVRRPIGPVSAGTVSGIVRQACRRSGLVPFGAHRLRHTLASDLLQAGASLIEVGQVLRHSSMFATAGYAKIDIARLRLVARPWPLDVEEAKS